MSASQPKRKPSFMLTLPPTTKPPSKPPERKRVTDEEAIFISNVRAEALTCWSVKQIARRLKVSEYKVDQILARYDIKLLDKHGKIIERIREELALNPKQTVKELAEKLDFAYQSLWKLVRRYDIKIQDPDGTPLVITVRALAEKGFTQTQISEQLGLSRQRIHAVVKENDIQVARFQFDQGKYEQCVALFEQGATVRRVRKELGFSPTTVGKYHQMWETQRELDDATARKKKSNKSKKLSKQKRKGK